VPYGTSAWGESYGRRNLVVLKIHEGLERDCIEARNPKVDNVRSARNAGNSTDPVLTGEPE
jgi:hypothetical protein